MDNLTGFFNQFTAHSIAKGWMKGVIDFIIPNHCILCARHSERGFCHPCRELLPWIEVGCDRCGKALAAPGICGQCQNSRISFDRTITPFHYQSPVSEHILRLKYQRRLCNVAALADMLALAIVKSSDTLPDALIPMPLHPKKLRQRGFNQAAQLARHLGKRLNIPVDQHIVRRVKNTASQTTLDLAARHKNVRGAFAVTVDGKYQSIAVVDDVITSGATMHAVCAALRKHRYNYITAWAVAKTT